MTDPLLELTCTIDGARTPGGVRLEFAGRFDLAHAGEVEAAIALAEAGLRPADRVELALERLAGLDGAGAVLVARFVDRLQAGGCEARVTGGPAGAEQLIELYRERRGEVPAAHARPGLLARLGAAGAAVVPALQNAASCVGGTVAALPKAARAPRSVHWRSLPELMQQIGADALPVAAAANLLVGLIVGFLGVAQLARFGAVRFVPELVVVAHFRELGPLVTAIIVAGRSGAGLASELGTMKVSEEIDALRTMGFDPVRWLVLPRCLTLVVAVPLLVWVGDVLAVLGGLIATVSITDMSAYAYMTSTTDSITAGHFFSGLVKTPFLGLAIGLIATYQGLATRGGAAAVGARTTTAVVLSMIAVILISSVFTLVYAFAGI